MGVAITFAQSGRKNKRDALAAHGILGSETGSGTEGPARTHYVTQHMNIPRAHPRASASAPAGRLRLAAGGDVGVRAALLLRTCSFFRSEFNAHKTDDVPMKRALPAIGTRASTTAARHCPLRQAAFAPPQLPQRRAFGRRPVNCASFL